MSCQFRVEEQEPSKGDGSGLASSSHPREKTEKESQRARKRKQRKKSQSAKEQRPNRQVIDRGETDKEVKKRVFGEARCHTLQPSGLGRVREPSPRQQLWQQQHLQQRQQATRHMTIGKKTKSRILYTKTRKKRAK